MVILRGIDYFRIVRNFMSLAYSGTTIAVGRIAVHILLYGRKFYNRARSPFPYLNINAVTFDGISVFNESCHLFQDMFLQLALIKRKQDGQIIGVGHI